MVDNVHAGTGCLSRRFLSSEALLCAAPAGLVMLGFTPSETLAESRSDDLWPPTFSISSIRAQVAPRSSKSSSFLFASITSCLNVCAPTRLFQTPGRLTRRLKELLAHNAHARANLMLHVAPSITSDHWYARTEAHQSENSRGVPLRRTEVAVFSAQSSGPSGETQDTWRFIGGH